MLRRMLALPFGLALVALMPDALGDYKRGYVDGPFGQIHYHRAAPAAAGEKTPIAFFHQNPKSAWEFEYLLKEMGRDRLALAFDTPGYGESDRPAEPPLMADLAAAMADALDGLGFGAGGRGPVDVFEQRAELLANLPQDVPLPEDGSKILNRWYLIVIKRAEGVSLERAAKIFLEDIHSLDKFWFAYNAVWSYPLEERFPRLKQPTLVLQPHELLLEETRRAHRELLKDADYVEIPEVVDDVFDTGWAAYARELRRWLDAPAP